MRQCWWYCKPTKRAATAMKNVHALLNEMTFHACYWNEFAGIVSDEKTWI